jgi:hypothetical protein
MAAKLGSTDVSFRLGAGEVAAVYLGSQEVWSAVQTVTLYFDGAVDSAWTTLGNWWLDAGHTVAATSLPTAADSVVLSNDVLSNSGSAITVANLTFSAGQFALGTNLTVTGMAIFNAGTALNGTLTGNATFNDGSFNFGTVTGNATFTGSACNGGTVTGTITGDPPSC